jgi:hypothetical protein
VTADAIATGHVFAADLCFLIAVILFALAAVTSYKPVWPFAALLAYAGLAAAALGWLLL